MSPASPWARLDWCDLLGATSVLLALAYSVPQLLRLVRTGSTAGVSLPAVANSSVSYLAWTAYSCTLSDPWLLASSAVGLPGTLALTVLVWRRGADRSGLWVPVLWAGLLAVAAWLDASLGTSATAAALGASVLWLLVPTLSTVWRSPDVSGQAPGTWWVLALEGALFLAYGLVAAVPASTLYGAVTLAGCLAVLARLAVVVRRPAVVEVVLEAPHEVPEAWGLVPVG